MSSANCYICQCSFDYPFGESDEDYARCCEKCAPKVHKARNGRLFWMGTNDSFPVQYWKKELEQVKAEFLAEQNKKPLKGHCHICDEPCTTLEEWGNEFKGTTFFELSTWVQICDTCNQAAGLGSNCPSGNAINTISHRNAYERALNLRQKKMQSSCGACGEACRSPEEWGKICGNSAITSENWISFCSSCASYDSSYTNYYPDGNCYSTSMHSSFIKRIKDKYLEAQKAKMTDAKEVKTQEIWINPYFIDGSRSDLCKKFVIPTCCPDCNAEIKAVPGRETLAGYLEKCCSHFVEWKSVISYSKKLEAQADRVEQTASPGQLEQITIPKNCPDCNTEIRINKKFPGSEEMPNCVEAPCIHASQYGKIAAMRLDKLPAPKQIAIDVETAPETKKEGTKLKIEKVLNDLAQNVKEETKTMDTNNLNPGDRLLIKITDEEEIEYEHEATVVGFADYSGTGDKKNCIVHLDEFLSTETGYESFNCPDEVAENANNLGLDPHSSYFWDMNDGYNTSTVLKKLPRKKITNTTNNVKEEKGNTMPYNERGEEMTFFELVKSEAAEAGLQIAANQLTDGLQQGLLLLLKDKGEFNEGELAVVKKLLASKGGHAMISWLLGFGLLKLDVPGFTDLPGVEDLAKQFRVGGMRELGNEGIDIAKQYFMPAIMNAMTLLPKVAKDAETLAASKKRVAELGTHRVANLELVQDEEAEEIDLSEMEHQTASR